MAKPLAAEQKRRRPMGKRSKVDDEEISEDEAFNEEDEAKYGRFFQTKKQKQPEETGELWDCLFEDSKEDVEEESAAHLDIDENAVDKICEKKGDDTSSDDVFTRREEDEDLFTEDVTTEAQGGFHWVKDVPDDGGKYASLMKRFKEIQEKLPDVFRQESRAQMTREERKELYEHVKKEVSKRWEPVLQHLKQKKHIVYGEETERTDPTLGAITQLEAETPLEKELSAEVSLAYERALQAREMSKNKRIRKIKSKKWHKRQKKRDMELYAKLIEKSNDPELTKELLESFEQKRSKHRILRKKVAQQKWAKLAMRFGDKNVLKEISSEQQKMKDDLSFIKHTIETAKEKQGLESEESDEEGSEDAESSDDEEPKDEVLEKLKIIANPQEAEVPQKGLFALKFMKDVLKSKIDEQVQGDSPPPLDLRASEPAEDYEDAVSNDEDDAYIDRASGPSDNKGVSGTKKVSDEEFNAAMRQIKLAFGGQKEDETSVIQAAKVPDSGADGTETNNCVSKEPPVEESAETVEHEEKDTDEEAASELKKENKPETSQSNKTSAFPSFLDEDEGLETFMKNLAPAKKSNDTIEIAKRLFVTRPDEEAYLSGDGNSEDEEDDTEKLKGWGSWTGYGIVDKKKEKKAPEKTAKPRATVKVSKKSDPNLAKYVLHRVPHPYKTKHDYNAKMETSIGPEWNTAKMHTQLVQPKTVAKVGSVIKPLSAENAKEYVKRMGKVFNKNRTHARL